MRCTRRVRGHRRSSRGHVHPAAHHHCQKSPVKNSSERMIMRKAMLALPLIVLFHVSTYAADQELYGTYRLISTTAKSLETGQEEKYTDESGYITYGRDGRMFVLLVRD